MPVSGMTHLSLFSGIGGLDLAAEWAGFKTVGQCEWADYPTKVLEKHWPDVTRWRDIRTLTRDSFYERTGLRTVEIISGGFPCQPFSVAGKQKGKGDDRYLWPEMLRVIRELTPRWVVGENVPGILRIAAADIVTDLEREGFNTVVLDFEAAAVGAPHRRERVAFIANRESRVVENAGRIRCGESEILPQLARRTESFGRGKTMANAGGPGLQGGEQHGAPDETGRRPQSHGAACQRCENVPNAESAKCQRGRTEAWKRRPESGCGRWWAAEPDVGRVAHGVSHRVDRLKCLGNAVVPQQFYPIFRAIADTYEMDECPYQG